MPICLHKTVLNVLEKPANKTDHIAGAEPERMTKGLPEDADKLGL
jgi:hypothetical protein